jgi:hypothetical protein
MSFTRHVVAALAAVAGLAGVSTAYGADEWDFQIAPLYVWAKSVDGATALGQADSEVDLDFRDDILENLEAAFMLHAEAARGDLSLFFDYQYSSLEPSAQAAVGPIDIDARVTVDQQLWELGAAYTVYDSGSTTWQVLGGARFMDHDVDLKLRLAGPEGGQVDRKIGGGDEWWMGFAGTRMNMRLSDSWNLRARADVGYKEADNAALHVSIGADYQVNDWVSFTFGYRFMSFSYDSGDPDASRYRYDVDEQGPLLGFIFYW